MLSDIQIRTLTINDYEQMIQLWRNAGLPIRSKGRDSKFVIEAEMGRNPGFFLDAFEGPLLVGVVIASCDGRKGWINRLAVDPRYRRQGIAKTLINEAEKALRKKGIRVFSALIFGSNKALKKLFGKCGYSELENIKYFSKRDSEEE